MFLQFIDAIHAKYFARTDLVSRANVHRLYISKEEEDKTVEQRHEDFFVHFHLQHKKDEIHNYKKLTNMKKIEGLLPPPSDDDE